MVPDVVVQLRLSVEPALAVGAVLFTLTTTDDEALQPFEPVTTTVYVVVLKGVAVGCATETELNPVAALQKYV